MGSPLKSPSDSTNKKVERGIETYVQREEGASRDPSALNAGCA
jgi:hypothetical protein